MIEIISRAEAMSLGLKFYYTGKPCKRGHVCKRYCIGWGCEKCVTERVKDWVAENPERVRDGHRSRYAAQPEKTLKATKAWQARNSKKVKEKRKIWKSLNRDLVNAATAKRRAAKHKATPAWADLDDILSFYEEAARLTAVTGIAHHVDHTVPLQGKTVCGLHVSSNLRVITAKENQSKNNCFWPDMWETT